MTSMIFQRRSCGLGAGTQHVVDAALLGADVVTIPPKVLTALYKHPLTDKGLAAFVSDWEGTGQSIL